MSFTKITRIRFSDCDPAGIVFYPHYFVLFNDLVEEWLDGVFEEGFAGCITQRRFGIPTVRLEADFRAVSRMGEDVVLALTVDRIGKRSFDLALRCTGMDGGVRMAARQTIVTMSLETYRSIPIPAELSAALYRQLSQGAQSTDAAQ